VCVFKVNSNILDKSNDLKQLREHIRKLDERLGFDVQVKFILLHVGRNTVRPPPHGDEITFIPANLSPFGEIRWCEIKIGHPRESWRSEEFLFWGGVGGQLTGRRL